MHLAESPESDNFSAAAHAAVLLRNGGVVAFPTETVYGLGAAGAKDL
jgi:tRNA A37 threonylcarbamoyladenosine synthetase subunit TsaC/SUA5/YrdC